MANLLSNTTIGGYQSIHTGNISSYAITSGNIGSQSVSYASNAGTLNGWAYTGYAYRSNGTGYYQINDWIQANGGYGIYWPNNYGLHIYPNAGGSYGALQINGVKNGWAGIYFNDSGNTIMANSNESGFHRQGSGWQFRWTEGTMYVHRSNNGGGTAYPVLDTGNFNSYNIPTKQYVWSRGENLLSNGTGLMGNNTNFSSFTFDGSQAYFSSGSFRYTGQYQSPNTDELMPVNPEKRYRLDFWAKTANGQGAYYAFLNFFDVDGNAIVAPYHMYYANTLTTLAQTLNPGDTVAYLTSVANWENGGTAGVSTHIRSFIFWNYTNSFGYTYPPQTYSRNWYSDAWNPGAINSGNNTITLRVPWSGPSIAAGTKVSNGSAGGTYKYIALGYTIVPTTWTNYVGIMDGVDYSGTNAGGQFPPGTAAAKLGFLTDYNASGDTIYFANLFVGVDNDYPIYDRWTGSTRIEKSGAFYGTIFYDSNDSSFYLNPNSTSRLSVLNTTGTITTDGYLYTNYNTRIGEIWGYGGVYRSSGEMLFGTEGYAWRWHSGNVQKALLSSDGFFTTAGGMRVGSNNLYLDQNYGQSIVGLYSSTRYQGVFAMGDAYKLSADGTTTGSLYGLAWSHPNAGGVAGNLNTHGLLVMENGGFLAAISGSIRSRDDMRAPIFYDSNDTNYYLDPNGTSNLSRVVIPNASSGASLIVGINDTSRVYNDDARKGLVINANYYPHLYLNALSNNNATHGAVISMTGTLTAGGYRRWGMGIANQDPSNFSIGYTDNNSNPHYGVGGSGWSQFWIDTSGHTYATGSFRAPIFYDSQNTDYYVDPNSTSRINSTIIYGGTGGTSPRLTFMTTDDGDTNKYIGMVSYWTQIGCHVNEGLRLINSNGVEQFYVRGGTSGNEAWFRGNVTASGILYASGGNSSNWNTAYSWGNHASVGYLTSLPSHNHDDRYYTESEIDSQIGNRLYQARVNGLNVNAFNATGLYRGSTGDWSNRPTITDNSGALLTIDTHPGDYHTQLFFDSSGTRLYLRSAIAGSWGSWVTMWHSGNLTNLNQLSNGPGYLTSSALSSYVPFSGGTLTEGNYFYFRSNRGAYLGATDSAPLQAYATGGNAAFMSFHRSGNYAVNFGLDSDNIMRIGGWSASADRWVLDMSGNNTVAGSFRAPIFYDSNDTNYYGDFNGTSKFYQAIIFGDSTRYSAVSTTINGTGAGDKLILYGNASNYDARVMVGTDYDVIFKSQGQPAGKGMFRFYSGPSAALAMEIRADQNTNITGTIYSAAYRGNANVGGTGEAAWFPAGLYAGSTMWQYGSLYKGNSGIYGVSEMTMNSGPTLSTYNTRNLSVRALDNDADVGILGQKSGGGFAFQIYGTGSSYGFLNGTWAAWDIRKAVNGAMYMNDNDSYYLQTNSTSNFVALNIQGSAVVHAGNIGSQSVSYATTAGSAPANGGNSSTVGGYSVSVGASANTIPTRNASGYLIPESWIQFNGIYGLYSPTNGAHLRPNDTSYGSWQMTGSRNGWQGIEFNSGTNGNVTMMIATDSRVVGFHNNSYGWQIRWDNGTLYIGKGANGGTDATILDSSNYSSWAQPIASAINTGNIGSQSVSYATTAGTANAVAWTNVSSRPTNLSQFTNDLGNYGGWITSSGSISGNAATATNVAWTGVTGRPTALSQFSNDLGNYGGWLTTGGKAADSELFDGTDSIYFVKGNGSNALGRTTTNNSGGNSAGGLSSGFYDGSGMSNMPTSDWYHLIVNSHHNSATTNQYEFQLATAFWDKSNFYVRSISPGDVGPWRTLVHNGNIGSQSVNYANSAGSASTAGTATIASQLNKFGDIYGQDWNTYYVQDKLIAAAVYGHSGANRPNLTYDYGVALSYGESTGPRMQMYFPENSGNIGTIFRKATYRTGWNGNWSTWKTIVEQEGNTCTIVGGNGTGLEVHGNVGYNQDPLTYFLLRGQADTSWKALKVRLTGDAGGQDIEFRRIAENGADSRMWYVPRGGNTVNFDYPIVQPSDSRLKDNITPISTPVDKIKSLRGVEFDWNSGEQVGTHDVGLIAQDVEAVLPEAVTTQEDGYKNLAYTKVIPLLVEAMKEQQALIEALRAEVELLKNK